MKLSSKKPLPALRFLLGALLPQNRRQDWLEVVDDGFQELLESRGSLPAQLWYAGQCLKIGLGRWGQSLYWRLVMFKNEIKMLLRQIKAQRLLSLVNIAGLAAGLAVTLFIMLWVQDELKYEHYHPDTKLLHRVVWHSQSPQTRTPHPMAQALVQDFPEVEAAVSLSPVWGPAMSRMAFKFRYGEKVFNEGGVYSADSTFFRVFPFELIEGSADKALATPGGMVITQSTAKRYFGDEPALGKTIVLEYGQDFPLMVTGVMKDIPTNAHFHCDFILSYVTLKPLNQSEYYQWSDFGHFNYLRLRPDTDLADLSRRINTWSLDYINISDTGRDAMEAGRIGFALQPIRSIHLHSRLRWELEPNGDSQYVIIFSSAALFILLIAVINYTNLATAQSLKRAREVGVRKALGATRRGLIRQFLNESAITVFLTAGLAVAAVLALLPAYNHLTGKALTAASLISTGFVLNFSALALFIALASGLYPAFILSAFQPKRALSDSIHFKSDRSRLRRILMTVQFAISIAMMICTLMISRQIDHLKNQNLGFDQQQLMVLPITDPALNRQIEAVKQTLLGAPGVIGATALSNVPGSNFNRNPIQLASATELSWANELRVDFDFLSTMGVRMKWGRDFDRQRMQDHGDSYLVNETAARDLNWNESNDEELVWYDDEVTRRGRIIGVVEDFHFKSLHNRVEPLLIQVMPEEATALLIKIEGGRIAEAVSAIQKIWEAGNPEQAFEYAFLDEQFDALYNAEDRMKAFFQYFALLAIVIAMLGLLGMTYLTVQQRRKELAIRRVLGAGSLPLFWLLSRSALQRIAVALFIAAPASWWIMHRWLENFAFRSTLQWWMFVSSAVIMGGSAFATMTLMLWKALRASPARTIRYE